MSSQVKVQQRRLTTEELNDLIIDSIQDIKGKNIIKLDLRRLEESPTDFFIICEGDSNTQVKAISDNIQKRLKKDGSVLASHVEGERNALWICLDYFTTVVHVFYRETRSFYELENLWSDARFTEYESL
ncbi:MAG: ribosome silencing factor [Phaeodactylibacter sp.]|nr:ribosome silencing factor [Phaeodactylibacter sp.]MCB9302985.1 ribosome silencing factor [Lewinellaceae bacterium]HQU57598.1 ribosome silencing factor [Saprospiraceae bacterium]